MHIVHTGITKPVLNAVSDVLSTPMQQAVLEEPLFLMVGKLGGEPVTNLGQDPLYPSSEGGDRFILSLICPIKIPH